MDAMTLWLAVFGALVLMILCMAVRDYRRLRATEPRGYRMDGYLHEHALRNAGNGMRRAA